jgi:SAM-dependent methyltransferase
VEAVAEKIELPKTAPVLAAVRRAIADAGLRSEQDHLTAEIAEFTDRLGLPPPAPAPRSGAHQPAAPGDPACVEFVNDFIAGNLPAGVELHRSIRIANAGSSELRDASLRCRWEGPEARPVADPGPASPLLCRVPPGGETTVIVRLRTPERPGTYALVVEATDPEVAGGWRTIRTLQLVVGGPDLGLALPRTGRLLDYPADHLEARELLVRFAEERLGSRRGRFLEVGGGIHPQAAIFAGQGHDVVNVDVSFPLAQLGALYFAHPGASWTSKGRLAFLCCDANRLPFAEGAFDAIVLFATLHHIAAPDRFLAGLRPHLAPGGFVGVFCEPCEPNPDDALYRRDLEKGINEQQFTLAEYAVIFERAGARVEAGQVDDGSLKAILRFG